MELLIFACWGLLGVTSASITFFYQRERPSYRYSGFSMYVALAGSLVTGAILSLAVVLAAHHSSRAPLVWVLFYAPVGGAIGMAMGFLVWRQLAKKNDKRTGR